jgi:hypothetical protein
VADICANCRHAPENHRPDGCAALEIERLNFRVDFDCTEPRFVAITELYRS